MYANKKIKKRETPSVSTASLPDIVFMLLFFFMVVTTIKNQNILVTNELPYAEQISRLEKKDRVIEIFVGRLEKGTESNVGVEPKIQLGNKLEKVEEVAPYVLSELAKKPEEVKNLVTISLKVDKDVNIGLITDIKEELRKINMLKVSYTTFEGETFKNLN